jgi:hypothetical protein
MKKILIMLTALSIAASYVSCKKTNNDFVVPPEAIAPIAEVSISESKSGSELPKGDPVYNLLGYGYDVTAKFDDATSSRASVVNMTSYIKDRPNAIDNSSSTAFWADSYDGENAEKLATALTNKLNQTQEGKFFKGTIGSFFSEESAFSKKYVYGFYAEMFQYRRLKVFKDDTENFKNHLSSEFLSGIQAMTPEMLVKKYGTHVLTSIILGAKLNTLYQAETSDQNRLLAQHAGYDAAMKSTFGMLLSGRLDPIDSAKLRTITAPKIAFEAVGGQPGQIKIITAKKGKVVDTNDWRQSINPENAVFIGVRELIPISALIENAGKKKEVEDYLSFYLKANEVKLRD